MFFIEFNNIVQITIEVLCVHTKGRLLRNLEIE